MHRIQVTYGAGFSVAPRASMRERVARLEASGLHMPQAVCPIRHFFTPGLYSREMSISKNVWVTGAVHKRESVVMVTKGRLRIVTDDGTRDVEAGDVFTCRVGMKNAVFALEDARWVNTWPNPDNVQDTDALVSILTESTAAELLGGAENLQLKTLAADAAAIAAHAAKEIL